MRKLLWALGIAVLGWSLYHTDWTGHRQDKSSEAFLKVMEEFGKQAEADWNSPKGEEARIVCRRIAGISVPAKTTVDVREAGYSAETADKYAHCLSDYMYPVDAKKTEEYERKAGIR